MSVCDKCWGDAYLRAMASGRTQTEEYHALLKERESRPCRASPATHTGEVEALVEETHYLCIYHILPEWREKWMQDAGPNDEWAVTFEEGGKFSYFPTIAAALAALRGGGA